MNPFAALESDDEEEVLKTQKKTDNKANNAKPATAVKSNGAPAASNKKSNEVMQPSRVAGGRGGASREHDGGRGGTHRHHAKHNEKKHNKDAEEEGTSRKKDHDRSISRTGRGKEVSKDGAGKGNWGNAKKEAQEAEKIHAEDLEPAAESEVERSGEAAEPEVAVEEQEPEPPVLTFEEYKAKLAEEKRQGEAFGQVKERTVDSDFSGLKRQEENEATFIALGNSKQSKGSKVTQRSENKAVVLDVGFKPEQRDTREFDKGGRGRGRGREGGRGRDGGRGRGRGRGAGGKIDISDVSAFPSL